MAGKEKLFIIFNDTPWETDLKKPRYYISMGLSDYCILFFISAPPKREDLKLIDLKNKAIPKVTKIIKNLYALEWPWWLMELYRPKKIRQFLLDLRIYLIKRMVKKLINKRNYDVITYFTHPCMFDYFGLFENDISIYNPFDKFSEMGSEKNEQIERLENDFVPRFEIVLCPSPQMVRFFRNLNRNTLFFPHGVDFKHYSKAAKKETIVPDSILEIKKPIVGYAGIINDRIDLSLLYSILENRSDWSVVMIGPLGLSDENRIMFDALMNMHNFHWLGYQRPDILPNFMKYFDVAIMPYKIRGWRRAKWASNPLKLHIYTAAGLPTVSCKFDNIQEFYDNTYVASDLNEWIFKIEKALKEKTVALIKRRLSLASENDWSKRVKFLIDLVNSF